MVFKKMTNLGEHGIILCKFLDPLSTWIENVFSNKHFVQNYNSVVFFYTEKTKKCVVYSLHINHKLDEYTNIESILESKYLQNYCIKNLKSSGAETLVSNDCDVFDSVIRLTEKNHTIIKLSDIFVNEIKRCVNISDKLSILQVNGNDIINAVVDETKKYFSFQDIFESSKNISKNINKEFINNTEQCNITKKLLLIAGCSNNVNISDFCFDSFTKCELLSLLNYFEDARYDNNNIIKNKIVTALSKIN